MARLFVYTKEVYSITIPDELLKLYKDEHIDESELLDKLPAVWENLYDSDITDIVVDK
jgi:hypothetical protein